MKSRLRSIGWLVAGFLAGGLVGVVVACWLYARVFRQQYLVGIASNANVVHMIRAGRQDELLRNIEANLTQTVVAADSMYGRNEERLPAFWLVQSYYERFHLPVPKELEPILASLPPQPPRPPCRRKPDREMPPTKPTASRPGPASPAGRSSQAQPGG